MLTLSAELLRAIQAHGEGAYPNEGAGLLLGSAADGRQTVVALLPIDNKWEAGEQYHRYLITPQDVLRAETEAASRGLDVVGIFHSHPDHAAEPSGFDRDWALPWYAYIITRIERAGAAGSRAWLLREDRTAFDEVLIETTGQAA